MDVSSKSGVVVFKKREEGKMYRPKGWGEIKKAIELKAHCGHWDGDTGALIEAGADAMLEALKAEGVHKYTYIDEDKRYRMGTKVFIPDEEER